MSIQPVRQHIHHVTSFVVCRAKFKLLQFYCTYHTCRVVYTSSWEIRFWRPQQAAATIRQAQFEANFNLKAIIGTSNPQPRDTYIEIGLAWRTTAASAKSPPAPSKVTAAARVVRSAAFAVLYCCCCCLSMLSYQPYLAPWTAPPGILISTLPAHFKVLHALLDYLIEPILRDGHCNR